MDFWDAAERLGHDQQALEASKTVRSVATINSLDEFKELFAGQIPDDHRQAFDAGAAETDDGSHTIAIARSVYGTQKLSADSRAFADMLFPVKVNAVSGTTVTITDDEVQGPSGPPWLINAQELVFDGGSVTAITTALTIRADVLTVVKPSAKPYTVAILGNDGAPGNPGPAGPPYNAPAQAGSNASAPTPGICTGASDGGKGGDGGPGNPGGNAQRGNDGAPNLPASITIKAVSPQNQGIFAVYTRSGAGGNGGAGGAGGRGQDGGRGGNGCDSGCEGTDGGNGGTAGKGGDGGIGGDGGNGVNGNSISLVFPSEAKQFLSKSSDVAPPGKGGAPGAAGKAGSPGGGGSGGKHKSDGQAGSGASDGKQGQPGNDSKKSGAPGNIG